MSIFWKIEIKMAFFHFLCKETKKRQIFYINYISNAKSPQLARHIHSQIAARNAF